MSKGDYLIPAGQHRVEAVIERSRFITTLAHAPVADDARAFIAAIRTEYPDATHHCWAYVAGRPGDTASVGLSDAGEPHGTAGRPMLDVLLHTGVGEIAAVVTRYYGGTNLGKGGLVRAYGGGVQLALATLPTEMRVVRVDLEIVIGYADVETLRRTIQDVDGLVLSEEYGEHAVYRAAIPAARADRFRTAVRDGTAGRARIEDAG